MTSGNMRIAACTGMAVLLCLGGDSGAEQSKQQTPRACRYEANCDCPVPGLPVRWQAAYCMLLNATDDYENAGVAQCMDRLDRDPDPALKTMTDCERNAYWKERFCLARYETDGEARTQACVKDPGMIPRIVEFGVGG